MEVLPGVHLIRGSTSNIYLVKLSDGYALVDAGSPGEAQLILDYVTRVVGDIHSILYVFVTHSHWDHVGSLKEIAEITGAKVVAHRNEAPFIEKGSRRAPGVKPSLLVDDGSTVDGVLVIHTPGHTPGSTCYLHLETRALFIGDLVYEENNELFEMHHKYSQDPEQNRVSIAKLLRYDFIHVLPSHGNPVLRVGREKLAELVKKLTGKHSI